MPTEVPWMNPWSTRVLLPALMLALLAGVATGAATNTQQKLYRWVDKNGQVHYGDSIPPEYAEQDRDVLNRHGIPVGHEEGLVTPEEARAKAAADKAAEGRSDAEAARPRPCFRSTSRWRKSRCCATGASS